MRKWDDCLFLEGSDKIKEYFFGAKKSLLLLGKGFDPRACTMLETLKTVTNELTVWLLDYNDKTIKENAGNESRSKRNYEYMKQLCADLDEKEWEIPQYGGSGYKRTLVISESVRKVFSQEKIQIYNNILIDVSAMPRAVAFSVVKRILGIKKPSQKLHLLVCENSEFDDEIKPVIVEESAEYLPGFDTFSMSLEASDDETVWLPVLGLNEQTAFETIAEYLKPVEICPVVPFPSMDIRRGENILRCYGEAIFRERNVEKRNIIYVPENHPILVYQKLYDTVKYYEKAFGVRKGFGKTTKYAFSSQSSKLIDLGVLLAMIDLQREGVKAGIVVIKNQGYIPEKDYKKENEKLYCLCIDDNEFGW